MKSTVYTRAADFLAAAGAFLEQNEAANNLLLGLSNILVQKEQRGESTAGNLLYTVESGSGTPIMAILLNSKNLILYCYGDDADTEAAVKMAIADIRQRGLEVPGVVGPVDAARSLALEWAAQMQLEPYVRMNQRIYLLDRVNEIPYAPGRLRQAGMQDHETAASWMYDFAESVNENMSRQEAANKALECLRDGSLYMWQDDNGIPVSMTRKTRPTRNGIVLSFVYTPPEWRGKGYASSCVASLSQRLLDEGYRFCSLYTDLANPTSNHIYSVIGYRPVLDSVLYRFNRL